MENKICVIGLGYVGLPLAHAFSEKYEVVGVDISASRIDELKDGIDATLEISAEQLSKVKDSLFFTCSIREASDCNIYIITVPTPIDDTNRPNLAPLINASQSVGRVLKKGDIVIYESTVYPGVTEEVCVPELERVSGYKYNKDFYCGYSPERINPGDKEHTIKNILKVTAGSTPEIADKVDALYKSIITAGTHLATSIKVAEASKVIENTQRDVNIALTNELALIFDHMGIDTREVIEAAATKWNFIKLTPGLVGGHCIGVDPYYLTFKAEKLGYKPNLILAARQINNGMGKYIAEKTVKLMIFNDKKIKNSDVLIMGATFKEDCPDMRNTKVIDIIEELNTYGSNVDVYDPWVRESDENHYNFINWVSNPFHCHKKYSAIVMAVAHGDFIKINISDYKSITDGELVLIDVKGVLDNPTWRL